MLGEKRLREIAESVIDLAIGDQTEVIVSSGRTDLTRFAVNTIHQNVTETETSVRVRAIRGRKAGVASGNDVSEEGLARVVEMAESAAQLQQENPEFVSLPKPEPLTPVNAFVEATAACAPEERADGVNVILSLARENGLEAAGAFSTETEELLVANSLGICAHHARTIADVRTVVMGRTGSGFGSQTSTDVGALDPGDVGREAVDKALRSADATDVEPGEYTVILEEEAVADMVRFLGFMGFGALAFQERRSFMTGRIGKTVTGQAITIWDDGHDPCGLPLPFDFEGVPKRRVVLIEGGVAKNVVYDSFTAGREDGVKSTGHALPSPNPRGPVPINLFMETGSETKEEMLSATKRGIWVTRFHYTNPVHPVKTVLTGMTRDGTFLIENGKIARPIKNLRFTQSILEAFATVDMVGATAKVVKSGYGSFAVSAPAVRAHGFRFTGTTDF